MVKKKNIPMSWASIGLNITMEKIQKMTGPHVDLGCVGIEEKGAIVKFGSTVQNQNLKKFFQGLNVMANHAQRPWSFIANEICGVEKFCELKKVGE